MTTYAIEEGLLVKPGTNECAGYVLNFQSKGAYDPTGLVTVNGEPITQAQVDTHNQILGRAEVTSMIEQGVGLLYLSKHNTDWQVSTWAGTWTAKPYYMNRTKVTAFSTLIQQTTVHFNGPDGKAWYGVNKGDNQILRARRLKKQK